MSAKADARPSSLTYDAFVSYSHKDEVVANGIQQGLAHIGRRLGQLTALRVFRDTTDLSANPDLWGTVAAAMDRSRYLIVVLSPRAVASEWVNKEVGHWLTHRGPDQLLIVLAEGHLDWDEATRRFAPERSDVAVPVLLKPDSLPTEPLFVDICADAPWDYHAPAFRDKLTDLAAPIHGISKYQLASADVREQRKFRRVRRAAITALAVLTSVALVAAGVAVAAKRTAVEQRNRAVATALSAQAALILSGVQGGGDVRAVKQSLAAPLIFSGADTSPQFTALTRLRHTLKILETPSAVRAMAISPDGDRIAAGGEGNTVRIWDGRTGQPLEVTFDGHRGTVRSVAFSPDSLLVISADDEEIWVWDANTGKPVGAQSIAMPSVSGVAFSADGRRVVAGSWGDDSSPSGNVRIFDAMTGQAALPSIRTDSDGVASVAVSRDGRRIASGGAYGKLQLWDAATGEPLCASPADLGSAVYSVAFSRDGNRIVTGDVAGSVQVWDTDCQLLSRSLDAGGAVGYAHSVYGVAFSPDGSRIVSGSYDRTVRVWDAYTGRPVGHPLDGHTDGVVAVAYTPDGQRIVSGSIDTTVRIWDADTDRILDNPLAGPGGDVLAVAARPDGSFAAGAFGGGVRRWNAAGGQESQDVHLHNLHRPYVMAFSPDGTRIASGDQTSFTTKVWDSASGRLVATSPSTLSQGIGPANYVASVAFSPDGTRIASGSSDGSIWLWDLDTAAVRHLPPGHRGPVDALAFSADGMRLASGGEDTTIRIWDPNTGTPVGDRMAGHTRAVSALAFSPDGHRLASGSDDTTVRLWDPLEGGALGPPLTGHAARVVALAFSSDNTRLASGAWDSTVRLWDAGTDRPIGQLTAGVDNPAYSVAFSHDDARVIAGSSDGAVRLWLTPPAAQWPKLLCDKLIANGISESQWSDWVSSEIPIPPICSAG